MPDNRQIEKIAAPDKCQIKIFRKRLQLKLKNPYLAISILIWRIFEDAALDYNQIKKRCTAYILYRVYGLKVRTFAVPTPCHTFFYDKTRFSRIFDCFAKIEDFRAPQPQ